MTHDLEWIDPSRPGVNAYELRMYRDIVGAKDTEHPPTGAWNGFLSNMSAIF